MTQLKNNYDMPRNKKLLIKDSKLDKHLAQRFNVRRVPNEGNGDCLFYVFCSVLGHVEVVHSHTHQTMRQLIVNLDTATNKERLTQGKYGIDTDIVNFCTHFGLTLLVINKQYKGERGRGGKKQRKVGTR